MSDFACEFDPGPGKLSPESGDMFPEDVTFLCLDTLTLAVTPDLTSDVNRKPGKPCLITLCTWTLRCWTMPELETDYSQKHRISQMILIESAEHPWLGSEVRPR